MTFHLNISTICMYAYFYTAVAHVRRINFIVLEKSTVIHANYAISYITVWKKPATDEFLKIHQCKY
jgi:hypothetical protein